LKYNVDITKSLKAVPMVRKTKLSILNADLDITTFWKASKVLICWEVVEKFVFEYPSIVPNFNFS
jgi:hypothetical protein